MRDRELFCWLRTFLVGGCLALLGLQLYILASEVRDLNQHLANVEREVQRNTATQERIEKMASNTLKSFGSGIE